MPARAFRSARQHLIETDLKVRRALRNVIFDTADDAVMYAETAVSDWSHKPRFRKRVTFNPAYISIIVEPTGTNAQIFTYVDQGTDGPYPIPKFIRPETQTVGPTLLRFRTRYNARTAPIARHHQGSGRATGPWVSAQRVMHPGIEARKFLQTFSDDLKPTLDRRVENAIRRATR